MKNIYSFLVFIALFIALILVKNQVCSNQKKMDEYPKELRQPIPQPPPLPEPVQKALNNVTSRAQSSTEQSMIKELVNNQMRYISLQAKRGSVGPNLPSEDKFFLNIGYENRQKELLAQLLTNPPLSVAADELLNALNKQSMVLRQNFPYVGGIHPKVKELYNRVLGQL